MRLDHLLSRENVEGETRRHILRSIKYSNVFVRDRQERLPKEPLGSNVLRFSSVSFSGFVRTKRVRQCKASKQYAKMAG